ncbi:MULTISPECIES: efflux RND transporter periplasmic adaptor subunit [Rosistilla]|uniref:Cation efflux system protein CusB n=2 Tax=Rosistilla TaxID=2795779 RepID=A0A518IQL1_9BACT|nr:MULTISPECIES: efflux RND transporter periplasmic adaptor subunit [Rosistilla]QDV55368.1 Cation efflux system protein CusB precursor [Rosistilla oblonga]QDV68048.1 Cation efflux system protein CusB precursor [Rosistilla carotiformis]
MNEFFKQHRGKLWIAQAVAFVLLGVFVASWFGGGSDEPKVSASSAKANSEAMQSKPSIWTCSMHPQIRRDGPGACPICGMDLVPVRESASGVRTVSISPEIKSLMNVQVSPVRRQYVTAEVRMVGKVDYDETRLAHITAWVPGRLERMFVDFTGVEVKKGDHMVQIYSESLYTAQEELLAVTKRDRPQNSSRFIEPLDLAESAREKLRLLGLTTEQIQTIEQRGKSSETVTIYSPVGGVVVAKNKQEGDRVQTGDRIYTVADLKVLWVQMDAYESDLAWLRYGQDVEFTTEAYPGELFRGRIAFIDPVLNEDTRTVKVRVNVPNDDGRLKPEMFVRAIVQSDIAAGGRVLNASLAGKWISPMHPEIIKDQPGDCDICGMPLVRAESLGYVTAEPTSAAKPLIVPVKAVLLTGTRAIVYVQIPDADKPTYEGREIVIGPRAGDFYLVKSGLEEGDLVVTNGNFKLDSALQISAKPSMMTPQGGGGGGHNHGGMEMPKADQGVTMDASPMNLVPAVRDAMQGIVEQYKTIQERVEAANLAEIREGYDELSKAVEAVPADLIGPQMRPQWFEVAMLLRNDVTEGHEINSMREADRVFALTRQHIDQMKAQFPLPMSHDEMQMPAMANMDAPPEVARQLSGFVAPYLQLSQALATDDLEAAKRAVEPLHQRLAGLLPIVSEAKAVEVWSKEKRDLSEIIARLQEANNLAALRSGFALLSEQMLSLERMFGLPTDQSLYELHCPMAFEGRGASWLQSDDAVRNPYYGASMLKCADKVEKL